MCINTINSIYLRVCIIWMRGEDIYTLNYGDGTIRTYPPHQIDGRVGETVAVADAEELWDALDAGHHCRVPVQVAMEAFCWDEGEFCFE